MKKAKFVAALTALISLLLASGAFFNFFSIC